MMKIGAQYSNGWSVYTKHKRELPEAVEMGILVTLFEAYEHLHFPIGG